MHPEMSLRILKDIVDGIVGNGGRALEEMLEAETVIAVQAHMRTHPQESLRIFVYDINTVVGKTIVDGKPPELCAMHPWAEYKKAGRD
jgi:hypothetical protein